MIYTCKKKKIIPLNRQRNEHRQKLGNLVQQGQGCTIHAHMTTLHLGTYGSPWLVQNYLCQVHMLAHIMYNPAERQATGTAAHCIFFFTH